MSGLTAKLTAAMTTRPRHEAWRKSSYSNTGNGCVELARGMLALRDSKYPAGPILTADAGRLVRAVKGGELG
jgi:hypothetical protein